MAQFEGRGGTSWVWIAVILLIAIVAILVYLGTANPDLFSFLRTPS